MKINLYSFKLKYQFDKIKSLHWYAFAFFILAIIGEYLSYENGLFYSLFKIAGASGCFYLLTLTRKKLFYSFWTFAISFQIYFLTGVFNSLSNWTGIFYLGSFILMGMEMYILLSPIFYPRVNWWEYDFRYRDDIKTTIKLNEQTFKGRLADLRRNAGCLSAFEVFKIGETVELEANDETYSAEIMSRREYSLGRPLHYGIRFLSNSHEDKSKIKRLFRHWKTKKKVIMKKKFTKEDQGIEAS